MDVNGIQAIALGANTFVTWSMSIIGASLLAILSTSYVKFDGKYLKLIYLLFIPGWIWLGLAIESGESIARRAIMATVSPGQINSIADKMNDEFISLLHYFNLGLISFGSWLLIFLLWWVFFSNNLKQD